MISRQQTLNIFKNKLKTHFFKIYFTYLMAIFIHNYGNFFYITFYLMMSLNDVIIVSAMISSAGFVRMFLNTANK